MSNFWIRTITGFFFIAAIIGALLLGDLAFYVLLLVINLLALHEFGSLFESGESKPNKWILMLTGTLILLLWGFYSEAFLIPILFLVLVYELFSKNKNQFQNAAIGITGLVMISIPLTIFWKLYNSLSFDFVLGYFILVWASDTFAYIVGRIIGQTPLFSRISPKKTWEGAVGGAVFTLGIAFLLTQQFTSVGIHWMAIAIIIIVLGTIGDLIESMLKRNLAKKDSGIIIPGHGGVLDRFDSLLFSLPFTALYLFLMGLI